MNASIIMHDQGVNSIYYNHSKSEGHKGLPAEQTNKSDTVQISKKAMELSQKDVTDKITENNSSVAANKNTDLDKALALFKEVGFKEYRKIMKMLNQIASALDKTKNDFPMYKDALEAIKKDLNDNLPKSVNEAMHRLNKALDGFPKEIRENIRESVLQHLEEEIEKDKLLAEKDSGLPFTLGQAR